MLVLPREATSPNGVFACTASMQQMKLPHANIGRNKSHPTIEAEGNLDPDIPMVAAIPIEVSKQLSDKIR